MGVGKGHDANPLDWFQVSIPVQHGTGFPSSQCDQQEVLTYLSDEDENEDDDDEQKIENLTKKVKKYENPQKNT